MFCLLNRENTNRKKYNITARGKYLGLPGGKKCKKIVELGCAVKRFPRVKILKLRSDKAAIRY